MAAKRKQEKKEDANLFMEKAGLCSVQTTWWGNQNSEHNFSINIGPVRYAKCDQHKISGNYNHFECRLASGQLAQQYKIWSFLLLFSFFFLHPWDTRFQLSFHKNKCWQCWFYAAKFSRIIFFFRRSLRVPLCNANSKNCSSNLYFVPHIQWQLQKKNYFSQNKFKKIIQERNLSSPKCH